MADCKYTEEEKAHVTGSFVIASKMIADLRLDVLAIRFFLSERGVTPQDFDMVRAEMKKYYDEQAQPLLDRIEERRLAEKLRKLLDSAEGKLQ